MLQPGLDWLEQRTGKPVLGVLPYVTDLHLEAEDAIDARQATQAGRLFKVIVPVLPRISNHTDFDPLRLHPQVDLQFVGPGQPIPAADLIILPGSKSVRGDLAQLRARGWDTAIARHLRYGGKLIGICGGLQMLGREVHDPLGLEGPAGSSPGLGLLDYVTQLEAEKQLRNVRGTLSLEQAEVGDMKSTQASPAARPGAPRRARKMAVVTARSAPTDRCSLPTCTACSRAATRVRRCCVGPGWKTPRPSTTTPCASGTSSAWPTSWNNIWTPRACANCVESPDMRNLIWAVPAPARAAWPSNWPRPAACR